MLLNPLIISVWMRLLNQTVVLCHYQNIDRSVCDVGMHANGIATDYSTAGLQAGQQLPKRRQRHKVESQQAIADKSQNQMVDGCLRN